MTTSASPSPVVTSNNNITSGQALSPRLDMKTPEGGLTEKENLLQELKHELKKAMCTVLPHLTYCSAFVFPIIMQVTLTLREKFTTMSKYVTKVS